LDLFFWCFRRVKKLTQTEKLYFPLRKKRAALDEVTKNSLDGEFIIQSGSCLRFHFCTLCEVPNRIVLVLWLCLLLLCAIGILESDSGIVTLPNVQCVAVFFLLFCFRIICAFPRELFIQTRHSNAHSTRSMMIV
jgi:hypothetical protein